MLIYSIWFDSITIFWQPKLHNKSCQFLEGLRREQFPKITSIKSISVENHPNFPGFVQANLWRGYSLELISLHGCSLFGDRISNLCRKLGSEYFVNILVINCYFLWHRQSGLRRGMFWDPKSSCNLNNAHKFRRRLCFQELKDYHLRYG